jgi:adenosylhomocysteine nucleosidase
MEDDGLGDGGARAIDTTRVIVLISADSEWRAVKKLLSPAALETTLYGECFWASLPGWEEEVLFFQGGWGKIAAAGSTQYAIDRWQPQLLVNLGTCGGFAGDIDAGTIVLAERTLVYDIFEQMGDFEAHIDHYSTRLDLSWLTGPPPQEGVQRLLLVSGDRDLLPEDLPGLRMRYGAAAGDWESGAIAWVAARNGKRCLILRGVSDLVEQSGSPAYGHPDTFARAAEDILARLIAALHGWLAAVDWS